MMNQDWQQILQTAGVNPVSQVQKAEPMTGEQMVDDSMQVAMNNEQMAAKQQAIAQAQQQAAQQQQIAANILAAQGNSAMNQAAQAMNPQPQATGLPPGLDFNRDSHQYYNDLYAHLRSKGYDDNVAADVANQKANEFRRNRLGILQTFMSTPGFGVAEDGTITGNGMRLLYAMRNEDPELAALYSHAGLMPESAFQRQWKREDSDYAAGRDFQNRKAMAGYNYQLSQMGADADMQRRIQLTQLTEQFKEAMRQNKQNEAMQLASMYYQGRYGMTPEQANLYALGSVLGVSGKDDNKSNNNQDIKTLLSYAEQLRKSGFDDLEGAWRTPEAEAKYNNIMTMIDNMANSKQPNGGGGGSFGNQSEPDYDTDNYDDGIRFATRALDQGVPPEILKKQIKDNWGELADKVISDSNL